MNELSLVWMIPTAVVSLIIGIKWAINAYKEADVANGKNSDGQLQPLNNFIRKVTWPTTGLLSGGVVGAVCGALAGFTTACVTGAVVADFGLSLNLFGALLMAGVAVFLWYASYIYYLHIEGIDGGFE